MRLGHINAASGFFGITGGFAFLAGLGIFDFFVPEIRSFFMFIGFILLALSFVFTALRHKESSERDEFEAVMMAVLSLILFALSLLMPSRIGAGILAISGTVILFTSVAYYHLIHVYPKARHWLEKKIF